ncbi:MAG: hypothetical protein QOK31_64, partial [Solirubrobacteraceae bacterium]|nr:hypothetical protein [Solirubrobacteraceae bacterium]
MAFQARSWKRGVVAIHDVPRARRRVAVAASFACLLLASPALADPVDVGAGSDAAVAVDSAGTSYIAYNGLPSSNQPLRLCKLPRGASACASTTDLPVAGPGTISSDARPFVSVSGSTVRVLSYRYGFSSGDFARDVLFSSADGGATFGAGVQVGNLHPNGDAVAGPGAGISLVNSAGASHSYQRVPTDGSTQATTSAALSSQYLNGGSVALVDPVKPLVVFDDGTNAAFSVFNGGPINDAASWSAPAVIGAATYERLAGGPSGVFAMLATGGHLEVRKFGGTTFGSQTTIPSSASNNLSASDLVQDAAGRLQALWPDASGNLFQSTSDDGVTWATQKLTTFADVRTMRGAAASDHGGVATWTAGTGGSAQVWATPLLPPPPPPPPDPGPPRDHPPVASFTITPALPCTHQPVTFDASASVSYVGSGKLTYNWEIGAIENQFRNPEDRFIGSTGSNPLLTRSFGPFRPMRGPGGSPYNPEPGDVLNGGDVLFGKHHRVPLIVLLTVVDEDGVASERIDQTLNFGDATYNPYHQDGEPIPPKPHCPHLGVPLPVAIGRSGLVANGPKTSVALGCPKANDCVGRVTLSTALASRRPRVRVAAKKSRALELASTRFVIQAGKKRTLALKLSKAGRRLLAKKGKLAVTIKVATTNQVGKTKVSRRATTLRLRRG